MGDVETQKYIRKPLYVDAVRVTPQNFDTIAEWCQGEIESEEAAGGVAKRFVKVRVHNPKNPRQTKAFVGDWILYTERGYKVYTNKAFRTAFDLVTPEEAPLSDERLTGDPVADANAEELPAAPAVIEEATADQAEEKIELVEATPQAIADAVNEQQPPVEPEEASLEEVVDERHQVSTPPTGVEETPIAPPPTPAITPPEVAPQPEDVSEQPPEEAAAGKRVLSEEEQRQMGPDAVREAVTSGEAILAQDLAETS